MVQMFQYDCMSRYFSFSFTLIFLSASPSIHIFLLLSLDVYAVLINAYKHASENKYARLIFSIILSLTSVCISYWITFSMIDWPSNYFCDTCDSVKDLFHSKYYMRRYQSLSTIAIKHRVVTKERNCPSRINVSYITYIWDINTPLNNKLGVSCARIIFNEEATTSSNVAVIQ